MVSHSISNPARKHVLQPRPKCAATRERAPSAPIRKRVLMPYVAGCGQYRQECEEIVARGYEGFALGARPLPVGEECHS